MNALKEVFLFLFGKNRYIPISLTVYLAFEFQ
jgi:hypothetical protein